MSMFKSLKNQDGVALIAVIFLMVAIGGMGVAVQKIASNQSEQAVSSAEVEDSYFTAQSGIELGVQFASTNTMVTKLGLSNLNGKSYTLPNGKAFTLAYYMNTTGKYPADTLVSKALIGSSEREVMFSGLSTRMLAIIPGNTTTNGTCVFPSGTAVADPSISSGSTFPANDNHFVDLKIKGTANITITGPRVIYVDGDFKLEDTASLTITGEVMFVVAGKAEFKDDSSVTLSSGASFYIHASDDVKVKDNATINSGGNAGDVLLTSDKKVKMEDDAVVVAGAYATDKFELKDNADFTGSFGSDNSSKQKDSSTFSYDSNGGNGITGNSDFKVCNAMTNGLSGNFN